MLNVYLIPKLKQFNLIGVVNIALSTTSSSNLAFIIVCLAPYSPTKRCYRMKISTYCRNRSNIALSCSFTFKFWDDAFSTAGYLINRMPTLVLKNHSPFETLFKCSPDYTFLRTFGCLCWPNLRTYNSNKLKPRFVPCLFLGYSPLHKGYKCLHLPTNRLYFSRDAIFTEYAFPYIPTLSHLSLILVILGSSSPCLLSCHSRLHNPHNLS